MDEKSAWTIFERTGSVRDYLTYKAVQSGFRSDPQEAQEYADQHGRPDPQRTEYR